MREDDEIQEVLQRWSAPFNDCSTSAGGPSRVLPVVDLRPQAAFLQRRLLGACNVPLGDLLSRMFWLPPPGEPFAVLLPSPAQYRIVTDEAAAASDAACMPQAVGGGGSDTGTAASSAATAASSTSTASATLSAQSVFLKGCVSVQDFLSTRCGRAAQAQCFLQDSDRLWHVAGRMGLVEGPVGPGPRDAARLRSRFLFRPCPLLEREVGGMERALAERRFGGHDTAGAGGVGEVVRSQGVAAAQGGGGEWERPAAGGAVVAPPRDQEGSSLETAAAASAARGGGGHQGLAPAAPERNQGVSGTLDPTDPDQHPRPNSSPDSTACQPAPSDSTSAAATASRPLDVSASSAAAVAFSLPQRRQLRLRCLEPGCGSGRNLAWLAARERELVMQDGTVVDVSWEVVGVDSWYAALLRIQELCRVVGFEPQRCALVHADIDQATAEFRALEEPPGSCRHHAAPRTHIQTQLPSEPARYDLVLCVRFLVRALNPHIAHLLTEGGYVLYNTFLNLDGTRAFGRPRGEEHLLERGELQERWFGAQQGYRVVCDEVEVEEAHGRELCAFLACRS